LNIVHSLNLGRTIQLMDGAHVVPLPEWAAALVWLGAWCRQHQIPDKRLITFVVLPTRTLASAFVGLGCLLQGAGTYQRTLSWPRFSLLPVGSVVHWKQGAEAWSGNILGIEALDGTEFMRIEVTRPLARGKKGAIRLVSRNYFDNCRFSEEKPPSSSKIASIQESEQVLREMLGSLDDEWIWADGAEAVLVTGVAAFERGLPELATVAGGRRPFALKELLCTGRTHELAHAKLRVASPRGKLTGEYPLAILDGADAFHTHQHLTHIPNLVILLDRSEYGDEIHDTVLQLKQAGSCAAIEQLMPIPDAFPEGFELASYIISRV
jgi:hypothetical protein